MKLHVYHRTHYAYASPVRDSHNEARLQPPEGDLQTRLSFALTVQPAPRLSHHFDFYLNCVHSIDVPALHQELTVEAVSVVSTREAPPMSADASPSPLSAIAACARIPECYDFLQPSAYVDIGQDAAAFAIDAACGRTDTWQVALAVMRHIHAGFAYTPSVTHVHTTMQEALRLRRGVCQDFAHVMIGLCRALGIPARYVSGYLYNGPADQLKGTQASHAWVEVYIPGIGWRGLDPTNGQQTNARYVTIASGRDYADVSPLRGTYRGTAQRKLSVDVRISCLDAEGNSAAI
jgi:transglutaminase-like putative cysteine protease